MSCCFATSCRKNRRIRLYWTYAAANRLLLITCNRDDFIPLARSRTHFGLIVLIRRRSRIVECANLLRLLNSAGESGLAGNINFA